MYSNITPVIATMYTKTYITNSAPPIITGLVRPCSKNYFMQRSKKKTVHNNLVIKLDRVTKSKCMTNNLLLVMCSHRGMHANPGIDEKGGMMHKISEVFVPYWCNLRL